MRSSHLDAVRALPSSSPLLLPSIKEEQFDGFHTLGFLERLKSAVFRDRPGVGKTHLAITPTIATAESSRRISYGT